MAEPSSSSDNNSPVAKPESPQNLHLAQYEAHLKSLAKEMGSVFLRGRKDMSWLIQHASADFEGVHDLSPGVMTMVDFIQLAQKLNSVHPQYRSLEVLDDWVEWNVDESAEGSEIELCGVVWQFTRVVIDTQGTVRDNMRLSRWKRRPEGVWLCYHYALWRCDPVASAQMASSF